MPPLAAVTGSARHRIELGPVLVAGHRVALRTTRLSDFEAWRAIRLRDRELIEPYWTSSALSWEQRHSRPWWIREFLRQRRARAAGRAVQLSVLVDGALAGQCALAPIDPRNHSAELGIWLDSRRAGHGVGTVAGALTTDFGFHELGLHRITAPVCVGNYPARGASVRGGMSLEATMIRAMSVGGQPRDHELWAVTADKAPTGGYVTALIASGVATERISAESTSGLTRLAERWRTVRAAAPISVLTVAARYYLGAPLRHGTGNALPLPDALYTHDTGNHPISLRKHQSRIRSRRDASIRYEVTAARHPLGNLILDTDGAHPRLTLELTPDPADTKAAATALQLLIDYTRDELRLDRVEACLDPAATHLPAIAEAAGLHREGVLTGARIGPDGRFHNVELWAAI
ncbi:GNAT family N-acetyltransferase [Nocardia sp. NBC_01503]|uniref:GNAT family N-acetyltransferase n=1 Tax=Nocardia sp. NBC_01503 TaxID=2975997 RepID=UPI002E7AE956|nr:GNAT family protein [Nocardia sp. NBC_01503]WTL31836.1 GNAT family N-acetyltransferase [Nocardia sp. NBC_01503]